MTAVTFQAHLRPCRARKTFACCAHANVDQFCAHNTAANSRRQLLLGSAALLASSGTLSELQLAHASTVIQEATQLVPTSQIAPNLAISQGAKAFLHAVQVIKGCWQLSGGHTGDPSTNRTSGAAAVEDFSRFASAGVTTLDTADHYGPSEELIGRYLKQIKAGQASSPRPPTVLTKACFFSSDQYTAKNLDVVKQRVDQSCSRMGLATLPMVQIYWQQYDIKNYVAAALHLAELQAAGRIQTIGTTNFDVPRLQEMVKAGALIVSVQCQYSLLDRRPDNRMIDFCKANDISILPYGVLAGGFLTDAFLGVPASQVKVDTYSKSKYARVLGEAGGWDWLQELLATLRIVADKHNSTIANVSARWVLQRPQVAAIIVGARNANHVDDYPQIFSFTLDAEDLGRIGEVLKKGKPSKGDCYDWERGQGW